MTHETDGDGPGRGSSGGVRRWRVFVSSPSDVLAEREAVERVARRVAAEFENRIAFDLVRWETSHYTALKGFQDQIPATADCDLVVSVFWSRLGLELPALPEGAGADAPRFARADGSPRTGSEYEFETALEAARRREAEGGEPTPDILVFRNVGPLPPASAAEIDAVAAQVRQVEGFFQRWFHSEAGHFTAAYSKYATLPEFERQLHAQLTSWVARRLSRARWLTGSPFLGLAAYEAEHEAIFFGRGRASRACLARLRAALLREGGLGFLLIVGASGAGKSSLARAGLVPRLLGAGGLTDADFCGSLAVKPASLEEDGDVFGRLASAFLAAHPGLALVEPGATPASLAQRMRERPDAAALLVRLANERRGPGAGGARETRRVAFLVLVDQLEEAFALPDRGAALARFLAALVTERAAVVVATLRSDRYAEMLALSDLTAMKAGGASFDLGAPSPADIAEIVRRPAEIAHLAYERDEGAERDLAAELIEAASAPGALPLLSFTLDRLYGLREPPREGAEGPARLTLAAFDRLGGLAGAIGTVADAAFGALLRPGAQGGMVEADARRALGRVLRRLVRIDGSGTESARTARLDDFAPGSAERRIVDALVERRLLVISGAGEAPELRIAHEALLRAWGLARARLDEDRENLLRLSHVEAQWEHWRLGQESADLLVPPGLPLEEARKLAHDFAGDLDPGIAAYVERSVAADAARLAAEARRRRRERVLTRVALAASLLFAAVGATAAFYYVEAERQTGMATASAAQARERAALFSARLTREMADQGQIDSALVLGLDAAASFAGKPVPDEILISLGRATRDAALRDDLTLPKADALFDLGASGVLFWSAGERALFALGADGAAARIATGDVADIRAVAGPPEGGEALWLAADGRFGAVDSAARGFRVLGTLPPAPDLPAGEVYLEAESEFLATANGHLIVITPFGVPSSDGSYLDETRGTLVRLREPVEGRTLAALLPGQALAYGRLDGRDLLFNRWTSEEEPVLPMWEIREGALAETSDLGTGGSAPTRLVLSACARGAEFDPADVLDGGAFDPSNNQFLTSCRVDPEGMTLNYEFHGSGGPSQTSEVHAGGESYDMAARAREIASARADMPVPTLSYPTIAIRSPDPEGPLNLYVVNRDVFLFDSSDMILHQRLPVPADHAAFLGPDRFVAGALGSGVATLFRVPENYGRTAGVPVEDGAAALARPRLHPGDCTALRLDMERPENRVTKVSFAGASLAFARGEAGEDDRAPYRVTLTKGGETREIDLPPVFCLAVSPTGERFATVETETIEVFDTARFLEGGDLEAARAMSFEAESYTQAFLLPEGAGLVGIGGSTLATLWAPEAPSEGCAARGDCPPAGDAPWKESLLFQSPTAILRGEPDAAARRLVTLIDAGSGGQMRQVQNIAAGLVEAEFTDSYKWGGMGFLADGTVLVQEGEVQEWRPAPAEAVLDAARAALAPACLPPEGQPWRASPCWSQKATF